MKFDCHINIIVSRILNQNLLNNTYFIMKTWTCIMNCDIV